jgi:hypothetical protein
VALLADIAGPVYGQAPARQRQAVAAAAGGFHVDPTVALELPAAWGRSSARPPIARPPRCPARVG